MMRSFLLAAAALAACMPAFAQRAPAVTETQLDALQAFARTYGAVRYFHPSDSLDKIDWNRFLVHGAERMGAVADVAAIGPALESLYGAPVAGFKVVPQGSPAPGIAGEGPLVEWRHLGYGMDPMPSNQPYVSWRTHHKPLHDGGIKPGFFQHEGVAAIVKAEDPVVRIPVAGEREALVPVSMPMSATKVGEAQEAQLKELAAKLEGIKTDTDTYTRAQAWADGIAAWNVARHFYPYWSVVSIDWDAVLRKWLAAQPPQQSREHLREALRRLIAPLDDGHGRIIDTKDKRPKQLLPITVRPLGDRWVVEASAAPDRVKPGDVIVAVGNMPADRYFAALMAIQSGSPQFVRWRAARDFVLGPVGETLALRVARAGKLVNTSLKFDQPKTTFMPRPEPFAEVRPGIYYVDLSRFDAAAFGAAREKLAAASGIVFDLRGYPSPDASQVVRFWLTGPDTAQWMVVPRFDKPFGRYDTGWSFGWQVEGDGAIAKARKALLVDGRALSYAESLIGYFAGQKTGRILGERSGGANGNVDIAALPSGLNYLFTGMKVTRHDGSVFHREGFAPDEEVAPTIAGLAAGRDEVLERAVASLQQP